MAKEKSLRLVIVRFLTTERAIEIITSGVQPLRELIGAMHSKLLLAELRRVSGGRAAAG